MSFFDNDVTAKEQLHGTVGSAVAPSAGISGGNVEIVLRPRKRKGLPDSLLIALREWLQFKVKEND